MKRYRGRFGFCPAWITDPDGDCIVEPRYWALWPLLWASEASFGFYFWLKRNDPDFEPMWPILVEEDPA